MFQFIVILLSMNAYSGSWGAPTQNTMLSISLNLLANSCQNPFLSTQMKNKIKDCHVPVPPYHEKQFECLLFYDINRQLCEAVSSSKFALSEDYTPKILEKQDVSELCNAAKGWKFTDMGDVYKKTVTVVFQDPAKCSKVCSDDESEDILNVDSTFYCKYYKWGSDMIKSISPKELVDIANANTRQSNVVVPTQISNDTVANTSMKADVSTKIIQIETKTVNKSPNAPPPKQFDDQNTKSTVDQTVSNEVNSEIVAPSPNLNKAEEVVPSAVGDQETADKDKNTDVQVIPPAETISANIAQHQVTLKEPAQKNETTSIGSKTLVDSIKKKATPNDVKKDSVSPDLLNQLEIPKPKEVGDPDDYPGNDIDSEEVRDGLTDTQGGDDIDDPALADLDTKIDQHFKKVVKNSELPVYNNDNISPKEIYPNTIPDGFGEDDDHFFPFFLTSIIMVVLLYVLYHNKNKVSKVFLGLIVEGRQPGRRRNSRGHAYRRLDTLEQAMSANTAAPPSKIIY